MQWVATYGASAWAVSSKVDVKLPDGREQSYFSKVCSLLLNPPEQISASSIFETMPT